MNPSGSRWEALAREPSAVVVGLLALVTVSVGVAYRQQVRLILKSLRRNLRRTVLTGLAIFVLVLVVNLVWTVLYFLDLVTSEKASDFKAIVTERWQLPSQMPYAYAASLQEAAASKPGDVKPTDSMTWSFYGGTIDPKLRTPESILFFFSMEPRKLLTMMDGLDTLQGEERRQLEEGVRAMENNKRGILVGPARLKKLNKQVGERVVVTSLNYTDIDLEFEIVGTFPPGRNDEIAVMNVAYLNDALDSYNARAKAVGKAQHPLTAKSLNLVWLKVPDTAAFNKVGEQIGESSQYSQPAVKVETASSGIASFLDAYKDLLWGMRYLLVPAILATMAMVIANAISISVRERRTEMAVMKVLGYGPGYLMGLVLGEALLVGAGCGLLSSVVAYVVVNSGGGVKFPIAFFPAFQIPLQALWWGPMVGGLTALGGSILPAWSARSVKVSEVFSKIS